MTVNDFVKTIGYTKNRLNHFNFYIFDDHSEDGILILHPTTDDYIFLCDREVSEWMIDDIDNMCLILEMEPSDRETFYNYTS